MNKLVEETVIGTAGWFWRYTGAWWRCWAHCLLRSWSGQHRMVTVLGWLVGCNCGRVYYKDARLKL